MPEIPVSAFILAILFIGLCLHLGRELAGDERKRDRDLLLADELRAAEERREDEISCMGGCRVSTAERWGVAR
jgi:hypothetical protein